MTNSNNTGGSAPWACTGKWACAGKLARAAQARLLWLHTMQIVEITTRYLDRGELRKASALAATGVEVSERCLRLMERQRE